MEQGGEIRIRTGVETARAPTLEQALQTFLRIGLLGKSDLTRDWYRKRLSMLIDHLGPSQMVIAIMDADLLEWYADLSQRKTKWGGKSSHPEVDAGLSAYYLHSLVRACRVFFRWLFDRRLIEDNPASQLQLPRLPKTGRKGIADQDVQKILTLAYEKGFEDGLKERDYALLRFLEATGARLGGLANLELDRLNIDCGEPLCRRVVLFEKGEQQRAVFMTPGTMEAMRAWLAVRPSINDEHVFLGCSNGGRWRALTENGIYGIVKRYARAAGVVKNWSPHQWRHRFGRKLAELGMSLGTISQIMGHKNIAVTKEFYGIFTVDELQSSYDRYMPDLG